MHKVRHVFFAGAVAMLTSLSAYAADVSGNWNLTVESPRGTQNPTMTLAQKGEAVSGTYKSARGELPLTGTLKGNDLKLSYTVDMGGNSMTVGYEGVVNGDSIDGKVKFGEMGEGKFSAKKAP